MAMFPLKTYYPAELKGQNAWKISSITEHSPTGRCAVRGGGGMSPLPYYEN